MVAIKGMQMPENCQECKIKSWDDDGYVCPFSGIMTLNIGRQNDCPLVDLGSRGDLIDRDALKEDLRMGTVCGEDCPTDWKACQYDRIFAKMDFCGWLDDAPAVIEAERESEE